MDLSTDAGQMGGGQAHGRWVQGTGGKWMGGAGTVGAKQQIVQLERAKVRGTKAWGSAPLSSTAVFPATPEGMNLKQLSTDQSSY